MGRRSTKTTKTGKFMNPTDQWRKQCRKKELKKNKQQRTAVREAVIKSKNPQQLLAEIEEIEKMEIEAGGTEELPSDKGLKEKKRKLHETLQRVVNFYEREDYNKAQQVKTFIVESEKRRRDMTTVYSSYRTARSQYDVSDIPLPEGPNDDIEVSQDVTNIPLPDEPGSMALPPRGLIPPGPPPGPPPDIMYPKAIVQRPKRAVQFTEGSDDDDDDDDSGDSGDSDGDDGDISDDSSDDDDNGKESEIRSEDHPKPSLPEGGIPRSLQPPGPPPGLPPPGTHYPPPPLFPPPAQPPRPVDRYSIVPPPSIQPRPLLSSSKKESPHFQSSAVISRSENTPTGTGSKTQTATISAQPQIRNVQAEVTKFLPTSLRVRRDHPYRSVKHPAPPRQQLSMGSTTAKRSTTVPQNKGDAYDTFMKEMEGLL